MEKHPPRAPVQAAIYARISRDREGAGLGVERQEADCRALAERLGWDVVGVYVDNDISAASGKWRPGYRTMLDAVRRGEVKAIVAWHTDRLHRRPTELEEFISLAEARELQVQTVKSGDLNLSTSSGRMVARMLGAAARAEVDNTRDRLRSQKAQAAEAGLWRGGRRPFGYAKDGVTVNQKEAEVIREMTTAILNGRSLRSLAAVLNDRKIVTTSGNEWSPIALREMLLRPRNAGKVSTGRVRTRDPQIIAKAKWPAIIDEDTWHAVHTLLTEPSRKAANHTSRSRWIGTNLYTCGECGAVMRPSSSTRPNKTKEPTQFNYYRCAVATHVTIGSKDTDKYVREVVAALIRDPRVIAGLTPSDTSDLISADRERRAVLTTRLDQFETDYALGKITGSQLAKATATVEAEMEQVETRLADAVARSTTNPILGAVDPGAAFKAAPVEVQRAVTAAVLRVEVLRATRKGVPWTKDRLRLTDLLGRPVEVEVEATA
ncbi:hypothetical protein ASE25_07845 [Terrabacter sp. Root85]|uniref:recombinase family protein n=1 Tax=Terrabacter sp. Root85 TaxID=1736603 RepID=UPI000701A00B|nr:recombinase family protein [Terrabacter sp. Root85]KRC89499.1 hypothetical protein ASE25_07845 [Terrabacter sp. Root85]